MEPPEINLQALITFKNKHIQDKEGRDKQIVSPGEEEPTLKKVWEDLPPNVGRPTPW